MIYTTITNQNVTRNCGFVVLTGLPQPLNFLHAKAPRAYYVNNDIFFTTSYSKGGESIMFYHMIVSFSNGTTADFEVKADNDTQAFRRALNNSYVQEIAENTNIKTIAVLEMKQL